MNQFFSIDILKQVLNQYDWPAEYELQEVISGNIRVQFPNCTLIISESYESSILAYFLNSEIGRSDKQHTLTIFDAVRTISITKEVNSDFQKNIKFNEYIEPEASLGKVMKGLQNICILLQTYLLPCIGGDFSWLEEYYKNNTWDVSE
ncbi:hypothetical protein IUY40_00150 [Flavobacterium sp. ALJ2]|uniref:hypothetical protein n=1 Tax=Flavobacterium sp. ALJ2 TaxID=2786960 RepID=UPI00189E73C0|nr:hypothetical protein [Flavobacterium sp. ALJ2]MBF7089960.1 hypothetical protein [Flavobacterium sp. ALJ2]